MCKLPDDILSKIFMYLSSPTADLMKPYIKSYKQYEKCVFSNFDTMTLVEYMSVNSIYLDYTSKRHLRERNQVLKMFISPTFK